MNEHTPGFYLIELQRTQRQYDIAFAKLAHDPHNDTVALECNATCDDYVLALISHSPRIDDKITEIKKPQEVSIKTHSQGNLNVAPSSEVVNNNMLFEVKL